MKGFPWFLGLLLLVGFGLRADIVLRPFPVVNQLLLCDDTYLSMGVAKHWARGIPMSCDGLTHTNGFQPLYVFLVIPFFILFHPNLFLPVQASLLLLAIANTATAWMLYRTLVDKNRVGALFATWLWCLSPWVFVQGLNGMETGIAVLLMAWAGLLYLRLLRGQATFKPWRLGGVGLVCGLAVLARMDQALFFLVLVLDFLWVQRRAGWTWSRLASGAGILVASAALGFLPWLILSPLFTGTLIPVSGKAVRFLSQADEGMKLSGDYYLRMIKSALVAVGTAPLPILPWVQGLGRYKAAGYGALTLILTGLLVVSRGTSLWTRLRPLGFFFLFSILLVSFYAGYIFAPWYHLRYLFPVGYIATLLWGAFLGWAWDSRVGRRARTVLLVASFGGSLLVFLPGLTRLTLASPREACPYTFACWVRDSLPQGATVGIFQSGAAGYFAEGRRVVNIDGVVNAEAYKAAQDHRLWAYIQREGIVYLVDWEQSFEKVLRPFAGKRLTGEDLVFLGKLPESQGGARPYMAVYRVGTGVDAKKERDEGH